MRIKILLFITIVLLGACTSTLKYTWSKVDYKGKKFNKILVIVMSSTEEGRNFTEELIVQYLANKDITATSSFTTFPPHEKINNFSDAEIEKRILDGGYDGVLVTKLVDAGSRELRTGGGTYYQPVTYHYGRSIRTGYMNTYEPEYYSQQSNYVIESQLFNVDDESKNEPVVWSAQSEVTDPVTFESDSEKYAKTLVKTLIKSGKIIN